MAGTGAAPKTENRRSRHVPQRGEWRSSAGVGWQHGKPPEAPDDVSAAAGATWDEWMRSHFASHWLPEDLPGLHLVIGLYDLTLRWIREPVTVHESPRGRVTIIPNPNPTTELRQLMDNYGITPKGQQDRRWMRPETPSAPAASPAANPAAKRGTDPYAHLRVVPGGKGAKAASK